MMEFSVKVEMIQSHFDIEWGDTVRLRDIYTPFFDLEVCVSEKNRIRLPSLKRILLYSFQMVPANVWDEFDQVDFLRNSKFGCLESGSELIIRGPVHPILASHISPRFQGFKYAMLHLELHGREWDVNGDLKTGITEWLVEEKQVLDLDLIRDQSRLVVAWECAYMVDPQVPLTEKDLDV